ncbi:hypothetical protein [uncultured Amnibacterium sp.]|uniref:hypothetical protein n=1 Tax=uncultured Amnibacterium sp. TaxID=1631851 RepID=UPI0035CA93FC
MPEGDSVFRLAARLRRSLDGAVLASADLRVPRHATADLAGRVTAERQGLLQRFSSGLTQHTHLRLDGSWTVTRQGREHPGRTYWCPRCRPAP